MQFKSTYLALAVLAGFGLALGACSSSSDDDPPEVAMPMPEPEPEPEPDPGPTDLEQTQMDAAAAASAAGDAAMAAADDAQAAADATANIATLQTGEMARMHAMAASDAADAAMAAYMDAKAASDDAAAATTGPDAEAAWAMAVSAQGDAEDAAMTASEMSDAAVEAAMTELHIDGTMKSVGDVTIDAASDASSVTTGTGADAKTVITGLIKSMNPMGTSPAITGRAYVPAVTDDLNTANIEAAVAAMPYRQDAAARTFAIGKTVDSDDDMARLMIVTHYPGTNMVRVFSPGATGSDVTGTKAGYVSINPADGTGSADAANANNTALRSEGMFVPVSGGTDGTLVFGDDIAADAKAVELFSYTWTNDADPPVTTRVYVTLTSTNAVAGGDTTYTYNAGADIVADAAAADGTDAGTDPDAAQVTVPIPGPEAYKHLHFGVWAGLGAANAGGAQDVADMGIGFVQSIGDGMTGDDLPNAGTATYTGNWVAIVLQGAGDDSGALEHDAATLTANFDKSTLTAGLNGLATLNGAIDGSSFAGTKATAALNNSYGLTPGSFDGSFSGGFYGAEGAEAGGVFDFSSDNGGAFRGAFGGAKDD